MYKAITYIFLVMGISTTFSQKETKEIRAVKETVQNYFDGYIHRDIKKLYKAFDTIYGTMKVPVKEENKVVNYRNIYFKEILPKWGNRKKLSKKVLKNCSLQTVNIDIVDATIASVKIIMKVDKISYVDILSLHKIKGEWKITNKIYATRE